MKSFFSEFSQILIYGICIILFTLSIYNIVINVKHAMFLDEKITVSASQYEYKEFKNNVTMIENNLQDYKSNKLYNALYNILLMLKNDGAFRLFPNDQLSYADLYNLNNYFIDIINDGWFTNTSELDELDTDYYNEFVDMLIINANYLSKELLNNSNFSYTFNNNIRNVIDEEYKYILNNYRKFSYIILEISRKLGDNYA